MLQQPETPLKAATGTTDTRRGMDNQQDAIHALAKNVALRQLSIVAKGESDLVVDKITEDARLAGATEQEVWDALTHFADSPSSSAHHSRALRLSAS